MGATTATDPVVRMLGRVPLFQALPRSDLEQIGTLARPRDLGRGEFLYRHGDPGDRFYLVERGTVEILRERPLGDHELLAVKRAGETFGERSLLNSAPRSTSARVAEPTRVLAFDREDFDALLGGDSMAARLLRALARAYRSPEVRLAGRDPVAAGDVARTFGRRVIHGLEPRSAPAARGFRVGAGASRGDGAPGRSLWDAFGTDEGRTILVLLSVKGSRVPPAYVLGVTHALVHEVGRGGSFDTALMRLNSAVSRNLFDGMDECVDGALFELGEGTVRWSCAGNLPTGIVRGDGGVDRLPAHGPSLGILPHFAYDVGTVDLGPGDTLLAFTDTADRVLAGATELIRQRPTTEPGEVVRLLQAAVPKLDGAIAELDVAFVVVRSGARRLG